MKLQALLLLFFLLISIPSFAQTSTTSDTLMVLENLSWQGLDSIGKHHRSKYEFEKAETYFKKALETAQNQNGKDSLYALSARELGIVYSYQNQYEKATEFFKTAKNIQEKTVGKNHVFYANATHGLAIVYDIQGLYKKADSLFNEAKDIREKILGKEHLDYAKSCNSLAILYLNQGLYEKAMLLGEEAKQIRAEKLGKNHPKYASSCNTLANIYAVQQLHKNAETLYEEAKDIQGETIGKKHPRYAITCNNLANVHYRQGSYEKAERLYEEAKNIQEEVFDKENAEYARTCSNLGILYYTQEKYEKAEEYHLEAKTIREKIFGKEHPEYALSCKDLAILYQKWGLDEKAMQLYKEALQNKKAQVRILFPIFSGGEKQSYFKTLHPYLYHFSEFAIQYYPDKPKVSQDLFNQQLFAKGIVFSSTQKMKKQILESGDSSLINQYEEWRNKKQNYVQILQIPPSKRDSSISLNEIEFQLNELEREISRKSDLFKDNTTQTEYTWLDVRNSLKKDEAVVELIRLPKIDINNISEDTVFVALIVSAATKDYPELLVLENGSELENGAFSFYQNNIEFQLKDKESYDQYWKPIQDKLDNLSEKGYSKVYLSADGIYHKLNLNTLLNPKTNKYLAEEQNVQLITSSRDLTERKQKGEKDIDLSKNFEEYKAFLLGYPAYNLNGKDTLKVNGKDRSLNGLQRVIGQQKAIPLLEGTKIETDEIHDLFTKKNISANLLQNREATEKNIKSLQNPTILHIATHGFFIEPIPEKKIKTLQDAEDRNLLENPFLRSGLLLAGCQNPQIGEEDGILSAEEVMNLNFENTELVVASACETGLGDIKDGEGVYGLQRAFRQAGAKTILMSLWKVSDEATQLLMISFYKNLLEGKSKREAFKSAQLQLKEKYPEPYYWGAFVMVGE